MSIAALHGAQTPLDVPKPRPTDAHAIAHEAARYAVLRRLGSAIRHQIAGALQPVSMMASLLERRVKADSPSLEALRASAAEVGSLSRLASSECVALMSWIAPHRDDHITVEEGVADCLHLLATELSFRGFSVNNLVKGYDAPVARQALRIVLAASLMALTDNAQQIGQVTVSIRLLIDQVVVSLQLTPKAGSEQPDHSDAYRVVTWQDVDALAQSEGVEVCPTERGVDLVLHMRPYDQA